MTPSNIENTSLFDELKTVLSKDDRLVSEGQLLKNRIVELGLKADSNLIKLLLNNNRIKEHFFSKVDNILIFDKEKFMRFINNKKFLPDSYTAFKIKIGLTTDDKLISRNMEVVLSWPFKDCVLEGGQEKEDEKRSEIFHNEILAPDQIDRLLGPKVFTNFKKFTTKGELQVKTINRSDNLIIKGNNLLVLHSLKKNFQGKIKLIYIDPPYNTGNDSFTYNDNFNHSTWLTFMKNRLEIAKELLSDDGTIFISIDNNEIGYLQVLMDELFGKQNRKNIITVKRSSVSGAKVINQGVVNVSEYLIVYSKNTKNWKTNRVYRAKERDERYNSYIINFDDRPENWKFCSVLEALAKSKGIDKKNLKKNLGNSYKSSLEDFFMTNSQKIIRFASLDEKSVSDGVIEIKNISKQNPEKTYLYERNGFKNYHIHNGEAILFFKDRLMEVDGKRQFSELVDDIWDDVLPNDLHNEGGVKLKKGKKPEKLLGRIIDIATNKGDIVLDYHLGSGTSSAVAHKKGRQYIGVEQIDYCENDSVVRLKNVLGKEKSSGKLTSVIEDYDESGVSKSVCWKGGGEFIYCELKDLNEEFVQKINNAKNSDELLKVWTDMKQFAFLSYRLDPKLLDENLDEFKLLTDKEQRTILIKCLDMNNIYLNYSEIDDMYYKISINDKALNQIFYEGFQQ